MIKSLSSFIAASVLLTGCAVGQYQKPGAFDSGYALQIDASYDNLRNGSHVYFQGGELVKRGNLDSWQGYCRLYVYKPGENATYFTSVTPDEFNIERTATSFEKVESEFTPVTVASLGFGGGFGSRSGRFDPPSFVLYNTTLYLKSSNQPDVQHLTCTQKVSTYGKHHLTERQIEDIVPDSIRFVKS